MGKKFLNILGLQTLPNFFGRKYQQRKTFHCPFMQIYYYTLDTKIRKSQNKPKLKPTLTEKVENILHDPFIDMIISRKKYALIESKLAKILLHDIHLK